MSNMVNLSIQVPEDLYAEVKNVSVSFKSDFNTDMISLLNQYVRAYNQIRLDPAAKVLLKE